MGCGYLRGMHFQDAGIVVDKIEVGPLENNCYVVRDPASSAAIVLDAPFEADTIARHCDGLAVGEIVLTHGHFDHVSCLADLRDHLGVPSACHADDVAMMPVGPERTIADGDTVGVGSLQLRALHTPGHTPGGLCLYYQPLDGASPPVLFSGDTLFPGGPGNTARELGDFPTIIASIRDKLFALRDDTIVMPGHGLDTTIGDERPHLQEWVERGW